MRNNLGMDLRVKKHGLIFCGVLAGFGWIQFAVGATEPASRPPNIIFILADDLGYGDLGCYPHIGPVTTPNIDQLAASGVRMTQAYAAAPVCGPSRASLLTGKFPQRLGVYDNQAIPGLGPQQPGFVPVLQRLGYRTAWFGKWHLGQDIPNHPLNNGFDVAYGFLGGMHDYMKPHVGDHYYGGAYAKHAYVYDGFKPVETMDYLTDELTQRTINFIEKTTRDQPFFIYLAYSAPHTPLQVADDVLRRRVQDGFPPWRAVRLAMIDVMDKGVGEIMSTLKEMQLDRDTLVIFSSDNGSEIEASNGGLRGTKMTLWEGGMRVPLIASWPGKIPVDSVSTTLSGAPDMAATFLALAGGIDQWDVSDGVDLMPFWTGEKKGDAHEALVWTVLEQPKGDVLTSDDAGLFAVRKGPWKFVKDKGRNIDALYNLDSDPGEVMDLSKQAPEKKRELLAYGDRFLKECPTKVAWAYVQSTLHEDLPMKQASRDRCERMMQENKEQL